MFVVGCYHHGSNPIGFCERCEPQYAYGNTSHGEALENKKSIGYPLVTVNTLRKIAM
jgi:hypothetical protein